MKSSVRSSAFQSWFNHSWNIVYYVKEVVLQPQGSESKKTKSVQKSCQAAKEEGDEIHVTLVNPAQEVKLLFGDHWTITVERILLQPTPKSCTSTWQRSSPRRAQYRTLLCIETSLCNFPSWTQQQLPCLRLVVPARSWLWGHRAQLRHWRTALVRSHVPWPVPMWLELLELQIALELFPRGDVTVRGISQDPSHPPV